MTVEAYLDWCKTRSDEQRYELVNGVPVAMAGDSLRHNLTKGALYRALQDAVAEAGLPCFVFIDGVNVKIDAHNARIPDVSVQCAPLVDLDAMLVEPIVAAEVTSRSSERDDTGAKFADYFAVPGIQHYLIVRPEQGVVVHHRRTSAQEMMTALVRDGRLTLDPPGLSFDIAPVLQAAHSLGVTQ
ncbi:Uma2 family endonuclease [uncultured Enterovirga sp.]|uniref:Uma2 family endonuclease n=1 Tax=uncultured Enterovirga sp. TaxID=2026352 RepID=UPI0035CB3C49